MGRCLSLTIFLVSARLASRIDVQVTPHPRSVFSCSSSEASTNTNLIDEAVSTLGKAAFVNIIYQPLLYGICANITFCLNAFKPRPICSKSVGPCLNRVCCFILAHLVPCGYPYHTGFDVS